jgi:hypothetical protein
MDPTGQVICEYGEIVGEEDLEKHHIIEKRFKDLFCIEGAKMLAVLLSAAEHRGPGGVTGDWRNEIPYGKGTECATVPDVLAAALEIYEDDQDILAALEWYFGL